MGCVRVHHSLDIVRCIVLFWLIYHLARDTIPQPFSARIEKSDPRHFAMRYFFSLSLYTYNIYMYIYIYMIHDVANFKGNKFITNVLISLQINFFPSSGVK